MCITNIALRVKRLGWGGVDNCNYPYPRQSGRAGADWAGSDWGQRRQNDVTLAGSRSPRGDECVAKLQLTDVAERQGFTGSKRWREGDTLILCLSSMKRSKKQENSGSEAVLC